MDKRLPKLPGSRAVPQLDRQVILTFDQVAFFTDFYRSNLSASNRGRKQFRPNINGAAAAEQLNIEQAVGAPLSATKQEPVVEGTIEKKPRISRPPRGFDRVASIFELGVGQNAPKSSSSAPRYSSEGGSRGKHGAGGGSEVRNSHFFLSFLHIFPIEEFV